MRKQTQRLAVIFHIDLLFHRCTSFLNPAALNFFDASVRNNAHAARPAGLVRNFRPPTLSHLPLGRTQCMGSCEEPSSIFEIHAGKENPSPQGTASQPYSP
jgi:hypothetical protein